MQADTHAHLSSRAVSLLLSIVLLSSSSVFCFVFFFFNYTATTEIYPLSLHDALPILQSMPSSLRNRSMSSRAPAGSLARVFVVDRKSTRLNSSHGSTSYAAFCL